MPAPSLIASTNQIKCTICNTIVKPVTFATLLTHVIDQHYVDYHLPKTPEEFLDHPDYLEMAETYHFIYFNLPSNSNLLQDVTSYGDPAPPRN